MANRNLFVDVRGNLEARTSSLLNESLQTSHFGHSSQP